MYTWDTYIHGALLEHIRFARHIQCFQITRGHFFTNAFVYSCRMGTVGDVKLKVCIHVDKSFLLV